jgi:F-type H+-transporting ATPase subunit b
MQFDWVTFALQIVNVLVLLAILRHFLFRPVAEIIARRQSEIVAARDAAEAAEAAAAKATAEAKAAAEQNILARHDILAAAQTDAESQRRDLVDAARTEAAQIISAARAEATKATEDAETDTLRRARDLAETIARNALSALPVPPDTAGFTALLVAELTAMDADKRRALLSGGDVRLVAPAALSLRETETVRAALHPFGIADLAIEVDPGLIAGLNLKSAAGIVHNSLAHDLTQISEALRNGD